MRTDVNITLHAILYIHISNTIRDDWCCLLKCYKIQNNNKNYFKSGIYINNNELLTNIKDVQRMTIFHDRHSTPFYLPGFTHPK